MNCAGATTWITPPHAQVSFEEFCRAGIDPISTVGEPGAHGAGVTGMHGIGVSAPRAAAVAAATIGLAIELHCPKGMMLTIGAQSMMLAVGAPHITRFAGSTCNADGATPKLHCSVVPEVT